MKQGKHICETLKAIRKDIADANEIDYQPTQCTYDGDCTGTCPKCESETRWLERQLRSRQALGKAVTIAGLSVALGALSSCLPKIFQPDGDIAPIHRPSVEQTTNVNTTNGQNSTNGNNTKILVKQGVNGNNKPIQLTGDVIVSPPDSVIENSKKGKTNN